MTSKFNLKIDNYLEKYSNLNERDGKKDKDKPSYLGGALKGAVVGGLGGGLAGSITGAKAADRMREVMDLPVGDPDNLRAQFPIGSAARADMQDDMRQWPAHGAKGLGLTGALAGAGVGLAGTALARWLSKKDKH